MAQCEARNAAESRELAAIYHECRALPVRRPPSPRGRSPIRSPPEHSMTEEEHLQILRATAVPLESTIHMLKQQQSDLNYTRLQRETRFFWTKNQSKPDMFI